MGHIFVSCLAVFDWMPDVNFTCLSAGFFFFSFSFCGYSFKYLGDLLQEQLGFLETVYSF